MRLRQKVMKFYATEQERAELVLLAARAGLCLAEYLRQSALGQIKPEKY